MRSDPERTSVRGCWESNRQCYGPTAHPGEEAIKNLSAGAEFGGRWEASARELGDLGDALNAVASYGPFCLFPLFALAPSRGRRGGSVPPAACGSAPWAEPSLLPGKAEAGRGAARGAPRLAH